MNIMNNFIKDCFQHVILTEILLNFLLCNINQIVVIAVILP